MAGFAAALIAGWPRLGSAYSTQAASWSAPPGSSPRTMILPSGGRVTPTCLPRTTRRRSPSGDQVTPCHPRGRWPTASPEAMSINTARCCGGAGSQQSTPVSGGLSTASSPGAHSMRLTSDRPVLCSTCDPSGPYTVRSWLSSGPSWVIARASFGPQGLVRPPSRTAELIPGGHRLALRGAGVPFHDPSRVFAHVAKRDRSFL